MKKLDQKNEGEDLRSFCEVSGRWEELAQADARFSNEIKMRNLELWKAMQRIHEAQANGMPKADLDEDDIDMELKK